MKALQQLILIISLFSLTACANFMQSSSVDQDNKDSTAQELTDTTPEYDDFSLDKDTLFDLLVAELAAQRSEFSITLLNYIQQANMTKDVGIIKRAINAAQYLKDIDAVKEMALLWSEVEPDSIPAHQLLIYQYSIQQEYAAAMHHIDQIIALGGDARVDSLAVSSNPLPKEDKQELLKLYADLYEKHPTHHELGYSYALVQRNLSLYEDALATLNPILLAAPDFEAPTVLKANILYDQNKLQEAIAYAQEKFDDFPNNHNLGRLYATMLIEDKQLEKAESVFLSLMEQYPQAPSLKLSHAIVMLENKKIEQAKVEFIQLIEAKQHTNEANYYLARIADSEQKVNEAIDYYVNVQSSSHFDASLERSSYLMAHNDRLDEMLLRLAKLRKQQANNSLKYWLLEVKLLSSIKDKERMHASLNAAILAHPGDEQLLYARAMNRESSDDLAGMEQDLRTLIKKNPNNAVAINALGYTLADQTDRLEEAFALIQQALSLKPNNPAILDSMGWVLYRMDQHPEALAFLLKAFQQYQDGEIAAHLGEVLWALNQKTEAREVWSNLIRKQPNHKVLLETIQRLDPELLELINKAEKEADEDKPQQADKDNPQQSDSNTTSKASENQQDTAPKQ